MKVKENLKFICFSAILIAMEIVLNRFLSINTVFLKIGFSFVPIVIAAVLFGPIKAGIIYGLSDLLGAIIFSIGPYFPGFTVCAVLMGMTYGIFLYKKEKIGFFKNILPPIMINNIVFGLFINTFWISILYDSKTYWGYFVSRLSEYAILIAVSVILIPIILRLTKHLKKIVNK